MIELLLINSLVCVGFRTANEEGKVLYPFFRKPLEKILEIFPRIDFILDPLVGCLPCMASVWGIIQLAEMGLIEEMSLFSIVLYILSLCGTNVMMGALLEKISE
jgi:hypothetical protein